MSKIIEIGNCKGCPHLTIIKVLHPDGWYRMEEWMCTKENKIIQGVFEWHNERHITRLQ